MAMSWKVSKELSVNNNDYVLTKFGVINNEIIIQVRDKKTKKIEFIVVSQFSLTNSEPIKDNFFKRIIKKIFVR